MIDIQAYVKTGDAGNVGHYLFMQNAYDAGFIRYYSQTWRHKPTEKALGDKEQAEKSGQIVMKHVRREEFGYGIYFMFKWDEAKSPVPVLLGYGDYNVNAHFYYTDEKDVPEILNALKAIWPDNRPNFEDNKVLVNFWVNTNQGPRCIPRYIEVNEFDKIKGNYSEKTRDVVAKIVDHIPTKTGQIMLFSGEPGTGKTHALRTIIWEWRKRAEFNYIIDPMAFFGGDPLYLTQVLFNDQGGPATVEKSGRADEAEPEDEKEPKQKWRFFIMEDSEELLTIDAKEKVGQALSQLFNVTDGMIGQGLKIGFVMTTNAKIEKFHPAISRPGRCAVKHEFTKLNAVEADKWLKDHGVDTKVISADYQVSELSKHYTIAELYELLEQHMVHSDREKKKEIGFTAEK